MPSGAVSQISISSSLGCVKSIQTLDSPKVEVFIEPIPVTFTEKHCVPTFGTLPPVPVKVWDLINKVEKIHDVSSSSFFIILEP